MCGTNSGGSIIECYNLGNIIGKNYTGGITGSFGKNKIINCYNLGKVEGVSIAGICGSAVANSKIVSCYNAGELIAGTKYTIANSGVISNCYYLSGTGGTVGNSTEVTSSQLQTLTPTLNKAFAIDDDANTVTISETEVQDVWKSGGTNQYPKLKWQE